MLVGLFGRKRPVRRDQGAPFRRLPDALIRRRHRSSDIEQADRLLLGHMPMVGGSHTLYRPLR